jgi:hypothetical protein
LLSIKRCRELIGEEPNLSDEDVELLRKDLYLLANAVVSAFDARTQFEENRESQAAFEETLSQVSDVHRHDFEERAGILEAHAELPQANAESLALHPHKVKWRN